MNNEFELYKNELLSSYQNSQLSESMTLLKNFGVINRSSNVYIQNSIISGGFALTNTSNNGDTKIDNCILKSISEQNVINKNSIVNITQNNINTITGETLIPNIIQKGSIYNYPNPLVSTNIYNLVNDITDVSTEELVIPLSCIAKNKNDILNNYYFNLDPMYRDGLGDGIGWLSTFNYDLHMSSHYTQNKRFAYWSNLYRGQFTGDSWIRLFKATQLVNFMKKIPRNLNGYTLTISGQVNEDYIAENLEIKNFYNGIIKILISGLYILEGEIEDNDCQIYFDNCRYPFNTQINDNKKIIFGESIQYNSQNSSITKNGNIIQSGIYGDNNTIQINTNISLPNIFTNNSYNNKCVFNKNITNDILTSYINMNQQNTGNLFYFKNNNITDHKDINVFVNHIHDYELSSINKCTQDFRINDVCPKINRDCIDVGSIVGWVQDLQGNPPIPRGFYLCKGETVPIDLNNPRDNYYNGQLAYLLCGNIVDGGTITLPNIQITRYNDYYYLMYIIKYNNNFEHLEI